MDKLIIEKKVDSIIRCLNRIDERIPESEDEFLKDYDAQDVVILNLTRAVQLCVDNTNCQGFCPFFCFLFQVILGNREYEALKDCGIVAGVMSIVARSITLRSQRRVYDGVGEVARTQDVWGAEGNSGRVKFLPLAWAGKPKTSFRKNSDSPYSKV